METSETTIGNITLVTVTGRIHIPAARKLKAKLLKLVESKKCNLVIDCKGIETLSNEGVKALISILHETHKWGGDLLLASLSSHAQEVLKVSGFLELFKVFPDKASAVRYFSSPFV